MQTTWKVTEADRDAAGSIKVDSVAPAEPRSLADLLPKPEAIKQGTQRQPWTRTELAGLAAVAVIAAFVLIYAWATPSAPTAPPVARTTPKATSVPTVLPTVAPAALVGYFDYTNPATATALTPAQITRVIGTAGDGWRLVAVGSARVWIAADQVPTGIPAADPLPDLVPRRPAPAVQPGAAPTTAPAPCTQDIAPFQIKRQIADAAGVPIGEVRGWSCTSQTAAERAADEQETQLRARQAKP